MRFSSEMGRKRDPSFQHTPVKKRAYEKFNLSLISSILHLAHDFGVKSRPSQRRGVSGRPNYSGCPETQLAVTLL